MNKLLTVAVVLCLASGAYAANPVGYTDDFEDNADGRFYDTPANFSIDTTPTGYMNILPTGTGMRMYLRLGSMENSEDVFHTVSPEIGPFNATNGTVSYDLRVTTWDGRDLVNENVLFWIYSGVWDADDSLWRRTGFAAYLPGLGNPKLVDDGMPATGDWTTLSGNINDNGWSLSLTDYGSEGPGRGFVYGDWDTNSIIYMGFDVNGFQNGDIVSIRNLRVTGTPIPEPGTMAMIGLGLLSLLGIRRKK